MKINWKIRIVVLLIQNVNKKIIKTMMKMKNAKYLLQKKVKLVRKKKNQRPSKKVSENRESQEKKTQMEKAQEIDIKKCTKTL